MVDRFSGRCSFRGGAMGMKKECGHTGGVNECSCDSEKKDCKKLMKKLKEIDFSIIDTVLYLDAYPNCSKALAYYQNLKREREAVIETINRVCGTPVTCFDNESATEWKWIDDPWPWEPEAN